MRKKLLRSRSGFEKPESREEAIMQNILGASNVLEPSESNIEEILKSILYNTPYTKEAEFEIEKILLAIKNNGTYEGEGESRDIKILIAILNDLDYTEETESRIEELYVEWLQQRQQIKVLEGVPPLSFKSKGKPLTAWSITGNTVQNGTPTPDTPQEVKAVGDRTGNLYLWNGNLLGSYGLTVSENESVISSVVDVRGVNTVYFTGDETLLNSSTYRISKSDTPIEVGSTVKTFDSSFVGGVYDVSDCNYLLVTASVYGKPQENREIIKNTFMLNYGSTALPYEPYGYKIPVVTSADGTEPITTPIYLPTPLYSGEVMRSDGTITRSDGTTETFTAPQIPTINGTTVIDVDTAVKPSSIYIEYK